MLPAFSSLYDFRCEAINKANEQNPAVSRIGYRVFFPPQSLAIVVDRPDKGSGYDRTIDFELAVGVASSSTRNRQDDVRIVVAGELVTLRCEAGTYLLVLLPSLGSARFLARALDQKARLGSARAIFQKARIEKILLIRAF